MSVRDYAGRFRSTTWLDKMGWWLDRVQNWIMGIGLTVLVVLVCIHITLQLIIWSRHLFSFLLPGMC